MIQLSGMLTDYCQSAIETKVLLPDSRLFDSSVTNDTENVQKLVHSTRNQYMTTDSFLQVRFFVLDETDRIVSDNKDVIMKVFNRLPKGGAGLARLQVGTDYL